MLKVVWKRCVFSRASRTLRGATQVVTFLSVRDKKMSGRTEKVTLFNVFSPSWFDRSRWNLAWWEVLEGSIPSKILVNIGPLFAEHKFLIVLRAHRGATIGILVRCRLIVEKVRESRMVFSREFQTVGTHTRKARELNTSFVHWCLDLTSAVYRPISVQNIGHELYVLSILDVICSPFIYGRVLRFFCTKSDTLRFMVSSRLVGLVFRSGLVVGQYRPIVPGKLMHQLETPQSRLPLSCSTGGVTLSPTQREISSAFSRWLNGAATAQVISGQ